jgi:hypothetical protein
MVTAPAARCPSDKIVRCGINGQTTFSMYTIHHAEQALRQGRQDERTLKRYTIATLRELCAKSHIQVDGEGLRRLKKPYIEALLFHVRQHPSLLVHCR